MMGSEPSPTFHTDLILRTSDVDSVTTEIPEGHHHLRTTLRLADGTSVTLQEATVAAIVRAYTAVKTHPLRSRIVLKGRVAEGRKDGYAEWQLLEEEQMMMATELIAGLNLTRHPEGGWCRETYRSAETIPGTALPARFGGDRSCATAIYFLLERDDFSALHRIKSDEIWHFHAGAPLTVHVITPEGEHLRMRLGPDVAAGEFFQVVVPAGCWFGARIEGGGEYSLVGCTVAPGFDFHDFEMGDRDRLTALFPHHTSVIRLLTRG